MPISSSQCGRVDKIWDPSLKSCLVFLVRTHCFVFAVLIWSKPFKFLQSWTQRRFEDRWAKSERGRKEKETKKKSTQSVKQKSVKQRKSMEMWWNYDGNGAGDSDGDDGPEAEDDRRKDTGEKPDIERIKIVILKHINTINLYNSLYLSAYARQPARGPCWGDRGRAVVVVAVVGVVVVLVVVCGLWFVVWGFWFVVRGLL